MTGDRLHWIRQVFDEARMKPLGEREAFVAKACRDDADLRAEVESLLAHNEQAGDDFMRLSESDSPLRLHGSQSGLDQRLGTTIGNYHIESVIASGGMGTVYLAQQAYATREVAVKVLNADSISHAAMRRFQYESEILARLRHPNIAQVYEAGTHTDEKGAVPFFAMEYVPDAQAITEHAKAKALPTPARLELFAQVCGAVHHGHQKGIIHRDLKPANIMVDSTGHVKVIDFGVARVTDSDVAVTTMKTEVGELIGTLQYMSPEQCDADPQELDTRSDVYSLGVVLYELLCGQLPYDVSGRGIASSVRIVSEKPPTQPSTINRKLRGDLEMIVLKALEKDRGRRYESAAALAADVRHHLNREPIEARPPTAWTRCVRWVVRHPVTTTAAVCLAMLTTSIAAIALINWIYNARPYEVAQYRDGEHIGADDHGMVDEARLLALSERILHTWGGQPGAIGFAGLAEQPAEFGIGRLALVGYKQSAANPHRSSLCAYDLNGNYDTPIWSRGVDAADLPHELRDKSGFLPGNYGVRRGMLADVFPERPGKEIAVVFDHESSLRIIRVYRLDGTMLYQTCHDGAFWQPYWMSGARLLIFVGGNASFEWPPSESVTTELGVDPIVVFALRPKAEEIGKDWMPSESEGGSLSPVWYRWLYCDQALATRRIIVRARLAQPTHRDPGRFVNLNLHAVQDLGSGFGWTIDESGNEVICPDLDADEARCTLVVGDVYEANRSLPEGHLLKVALPEPNLFHLGPLPPIASTSQPVQNAPDPEP